MNLESKNIFTEEAYSNKKLMFFSSALLSIFIVLMLRIYGVNHITMGIIIGLPFIALLMFSFETFLFLWIITLFVNYDALMFKIVTLLVLPISISYLVTSKRISINSFKNKLTYPFLLYIISMLPSLLNTINLPLSIYLMYNLFAMGLIFHILGEKLSNVEEIKNCLYLFVILCAFNGAYLILQYFLSHNRVFGFSGIVYVDYSAIAILVSLMLTLFSKNFKKYIFLLLTLFIFTALLFTQTRNTLISLGIAYILFIIYLNKNSKLFPISRKSLTGSLVIIIVVCIIFIIGFLIFSPNIFGRFHDLTAYNQMFVVDDSSIGVNSSIVTRALIWLTALNAFFQHPVIGIGAFAFPFSSQIYYTIPNILYKLYVEGLSTHITFLSTLTETGIIGTIGFTFFLFSSLKVSFRAIKLEQLPEERVVSVIIVFVQIYILISMFMTDAWLWGQCGMLWGFILGLSIANYNILHTRKISANV